MIDNMIQDMIESEFDGEDIIKCLVEQYDMDALDALDALNDVINEM